MVVVTYGSKFTQPANLDNVSQYPAFRVLNYIYVESAAFCCEWDLSTQLSRPRPRP